MLNDIYFTKHARDKFKILEKHNFYISEGQVRQTINYPDKIDYSRLPLMIAQRSITDSHVLRVVYRKEEDRKIIITFYPGRKRAYE